jgi:heme-degrading monooxygenase HmoA
MIAVIFEVWPAQGRKDDYLGIAAALRADLDRIDGFISIERFMTSNILAKCVNEIDVIRPAFFCA